MAYRPASSSRWTPAFHRLAARLRYAMNRERILRLKRRYYRKNRERIQARRAEYRASHPFMSSPARRAYMRVYMREWRKRRKQA